MELLALRDGVRLGTYDNPVVIVPGAAPLIVDAATLDFLLELQRGHRPLIGDDSASQESITLLMNVGILESSSRPAGTSGAAASYGATLTDLVIKRPSPWIGVAVRGIAVVMKPLTSWVGVLAGLLLLLATSVYSTMFMPVQPTVDTLFGNSWGLMLIVIVWQLVRGAAHEAGHFAVARGAGQIPPVGIGLYLYGPVLYVDLTCLETESRLVRIRADLAGAGIDGWLAGVLAGIYVVSRDSTIAALLLASCMVALGNLRATDKYDGYWALRDFLKARPMSATWAAPLELLRVARGQPGSDRRFARALITLYAAGTAWFVISSPRWLVGTINAVTADPSRMIDFAVIGIIYFAMTGAVLIAVRRHGCNKAGVTCKAGKG
jgi:hypothetical protein